MLWSPYLGAVLLVEGGSPSSALDARRLSLLAQTIGYAGCVGLLVAGIGFAAASALWRARTCGRVLVWLGLALAAVPPTVHAGAWLGFQTGLNGWPLAIGIQTAAWLPIGTAVLLASLRTLDSKALEASRVFLNPRDQWRKGVLPMCRASIGAVALVAALGSAADMTVPSLVGRSTFASEIFALFGGSVDAAGAAWPMLAASLPATALAAYWVRRMIGSTAPEGVARPIPATGVWRFATVLGLALLGIAVGLPLFVLALGTGELLAVGSSVVRAWPDVGPSLSVAALGALLAVAFGVPLGLKMATTKGWAWWWPILAPLGLPTALIGIGVSRGMAWSPVEVADGRFGVVASLAVRSLPLVAVLVAASFLRMDRDAWDAGRTALPPVRFWSKVGLPMLGPGLGFAFGLGTAWNLGEVAAVLPVLEPGQGSLAIRLYNNLHYGASQDVATQSLMLVALVVIGASPLLWRPKWQR